MKKLLLYLFFAIPVIASSQVINPIKWTFSANKLKPGVYEVHLTANIDNGWHIYSQSTPDGGPLPTTIFFSKNPLIKLEGNVLEKGKLEQKFEKIFNVDVKQYSGKVVFVQVVKVKANLKTTLTGEVESMSCDDHQCLPPKTTKFSIALN